MYCVWLGQSLNGYTFFKTKLLLKIIFDLEVGINQVKKTNPKSTAQN